MFNNNTIEITKYGVLSGKIDGAFTIAQLSDLHEKEFGRHNKQLFEKVYALSPDIIAVTGDVVAHENQQQANLPYARNLAEGLSRAAPAFFVTGNHEKNFDHEIAEALSGGGMTVLRCGVYTMDIRGSRVNIAGMDDLSYGRADVEKCLDLLRPLHGFNLFLSHRPEVFELSLKRNIDLILAGHTHAGQIRVPALSNLYMNGQGLFPKYVQGEFTDGDTTMIISRGLGASGFPALRINNPPDLVAVYVEPGAV